MTSNTKETKRKLKQNSFNIQCANQNYIPNKKILSDENEQTNVQTNRREIITNIFSLKDILSISLQGRKNRTQIKDLGIKGREFVSVGKAVGGEFMELAKLELGLDRGKRRAFYKRVSRAKVPPWMWE